MGVIGYHLNLETTNSSGSTGKAGPLTEYTLDLSRGGLTVEGIGEIRQ